MNDWKEEILLLKAAVVHMRMHEITPEECDKRMRQILDTVHDGNGVSETIKEVTE